jgi:hypothetical protein
MELAMKAMERNISELDRRIKEGDFSASTPRSFDSPEYLALKAKQQTMRAEYENLREYDPRYAEQQRQKRLVAVEKQIADYEQQIATGNFRSPAARKAVDLDLQAAQEVRDALRKRRNDVRKTNPIWMKEQQRKDLLLGVTLLDTDTYLSVPFSGVCGTTSALALARIKTTPQCVSLTPYPTAM